MQHSSVSREPISPVKFVSQLGCFVFDHSVTLKRSCSLEVGPPLLYNCLYSDGVVNCRTSKRPKSVASLSLSNKFASSRIWRVFNQFNRFVKLHCERIPLKFGSIRVGCDDTIGLREEGNGVLEGEEVQRNAVASESPKRVLILMSDTGGGHRASAEAIRSAFNEEYGDDYQVRIGTLCQNLYDEVFYFHQYGKEFDYVCSVYLFPLFLCFMRGYFAGVYY